MSTQAYWLSVMYLIGMVALACASYNFMCNRAPTYEIQVTLPVKVLFLGGALFFGSTWPLWLTISLINLVRRRKKDEPSS
jgi:predicted membrane channel-forming protein YqfA (hemolysin III family)